MALDKIADKILETDVLIMGGGIAGCPLAVKAAEKGLDVLLVEKAKTDRSGSAAAGIDHYGIFPREGMTPHDLAEIWMVSMNATNGEGRWGNPNIMRRYYENVFWGAEELERIGLPMKWDNGEYYWMPHRGPGMDPSVSHKLGLRVHWQNCKPLMAKAVRKSDAKVLERTMILDLLTDNGRVAGATAINTRTGEFMVIKAKAVVISTGVFSRAYMPETPIVWKYQFRSHWCPASASGDGWAVSYRAGAELANMDNTGWGFRLRDDLTISFGNMPINDGIPSKPLNWKGEEIPYKIWSNARGYDDMEQKGLTPIYHKLDHLPDDFHKRIEVAYVDERLVSFKVAQDRGFNPRNHRYELMPNKPHNFMSPPGIHVDEELKTNLKGLFAVGDCAASLHSCGEAATLGFLLGEDIEGTISEAGEPVIDETQVESHKMTALAPFEVKDGTEPMELEAAVRYVCERYVGMFKSEGKIREGQRRLGSLRREFLPQLMAKNPHQLMRCLELRNIIDMTDLHLQACLERKESRGNFVRVDYPEQDPSRTSMLNYQRLENGKNILEVREAPELKDE